jgi:hypothetical protein
MNKELLEFLKKQHEFSLMEFRLGNEDLKEHIEKKYGGRITALEHFKTYVHAVTATFLVLIGWIKGHK